MKDHLATREEAIEIGRQMREQLPVLARNYEPTKSGKSEYTKATWAFFEQLHKANDWGFSPATCPTKGRAKGEYLTDFALFDHLFGNRIVCESEWGDGTTEVRDDFWKLRDTKGDVKIIVFQADHASGNTLSPRYADEFKAVLAGSGHHHPGHEFYLFFQYQGERAKLFLWEPKQCGPFKPEEIQFEFIA
jgi:hypothetical protein